LGFELRTAASGHDALDLLVAGLAPDAILMDLAMPGIDGWETIRRLRRLPHVQASVAVVSANAFDKGLDNDAGVRAEDFILKPLRHSELLDWLERQLGLHWVDKPLAPAAPTDAGLAKPWVWPAAAMLDGLRQSVQLGYYRGVMNQLDEIESGQPACASFVQAMRELARQFQFEAMSRRLAQAGGTAQEKPA
jgi:CheY-like chemotaxis protein